MGTIISKIEDIDNIIWTQLKKGRVAAAKRVIALTDTSVIIELDNGQYTVAGQRHAVNGNWAVLGYGIDKFSSAVLDGLVRMGILSKEQVSAHKADVRAREEDRERKSAEKRLAEACETLGIENPISKAASHSAA